MTYPRGRLPKRQDLGALTYADFYLKRDVASNFDAFLGGHVLPTFPIDVTEGITDWGMCGNNRYGDCGAAAEWHLEMATGLAAGRPALSPTAPVAVDRYTTYVGSRTPPGPGVVLATYLKWLFDHKYILGFAPVDHTTRTSCEWWMSQGYGLYAGVNLNAKADQQFEQGQPWDVAPTDQPNPQDGHCVLWSKSTTTAGPHWFVTWGRLQQATEAWVRACLTANPNGEAWLVVTRVEQLANFTPQLLTDIKSLGGTE